MSGFMILLLNSHCHGNKLHNSYIGSVFSLQSLIMLQMGEKQSKVLSTYITTWKYLGKLMILFTVYCTVLPYMPST